MMRRRNVLCALSGLAALPLWAQEGPPPSEKTAPELPALGQTWQVPNTVLMNGQAWQNDGGRPLMLYWWASTCPFCAQISPMMDALYARLQGQGMRMLALSVDKKKANAQTYLDKKGFRFPVAWVTPEFEKALRKPKGLPITVILDAQGKVLQAERGQLFEEDVAHMARWWA